MYVYGHGSITVPTRSCAVIGGYVYRGAAAPGLLGRYVFADYCSGRVLSLPADARPGARPTLLLDTSLIISSLGVDAAGELYLCDLGGGAIYRVGTVWLP